jgi:hypothetical protein
MSSSKAKAIESGKQKQPVGAEIAAGSSELNTFKQTKMCTHRPGMVKYCRDPTGQECIDLSLRQLMIWFRLVVSLEVFQKGCKHADYWVEKWSH